MERELITRRETLKRIGIFTIAAAIALPERPRILLPHERLKEYDGFKVIHPHSNDLLTPGINGRFIHEGSPEEQRAIIRDYKKLGISVVRILIKDEFEREFRQYNFDYLDKIVKFGEILKEEIPNGRLIIPLLDFYGMMNRVRLGGMDKAECVYQEHRGKSDHEINEGISKFYEDPIKQNYFRNRCEVIINYLLEKGAPIFAWEIANEPEWRGHKKDFNKWMEETALYIANLDPHHFIFPGVADPKSIEGQGFDAITAHIYPDRFFLRELFDFMRESKKPIIVGEIGMFSSILGHEVNLDRELAEFKLFVFENSSIIDHHNKIIIPSLSAMYIWQFSHEKDMFTFDPNKMPETVAMLKGINELLNRGT